jgi:transposase
MRPRLLNAVRGLARQQRIELRPRALLTRTGWGELAAAELSPALREVVEAYKATVAATTAALGTLDRQLTQRARRDPRVARLETMPEVGQVSAQTLVAAVDTIERFATAKKLVPYAGSPRACAPAASGWSTGASPSRDGARSARCGSRPRTPPRRQGRWSRCWNRPTPEHRRG